MTNRQLHDCINGCKRKDPLCQKNLYLRFYDFGMSIASRYGSSKQDAEEIANDSFYKMLAKIDYYKSEIPFQLWLRKIIINTGIDFYRKRKNRLNKVYEHGVVKVQNEAEEMIRKDYLESLLNCLPPQYKMVFILHVIEGFSHKEIASRLDIGIGTSKSNLSKARVKLKIFIKAQEQKIRYEGQAAR